VAPGRLPEMFAKMQEAFDRAGEENSVTPIRMFYREWAVIVEIERHPPGRGDRPRRTLDSSR
jgi:hypothetical protein